MHFLSIVKKTFLYDIHCKIFFLWFMAFRNRSQRGYYRFTAVGILMNSIQHKMVVQCCLKLWEVLECFVEAFGENLCVGLLVITIDEKVIPTKDCLVHEFKIDLEFDERCTPMVSEIFTFLHDPLNLMNWLRHWYRLNKNSLKQVYNRKYILKYDYGYDSDEIKKPEDW